MSGRKPALLCHKTLGIDLKLILSEHIVGEPYTRKHGKDGQRVDYSHHPMGTIGIDRGHGLVFEKLHSDIGGKRNVYGVDYEQIARSKKIMELQSGQSVTGSAKRWHKRRGDGHTRDDIAFGPASESDDARSATEKSDQYIVDGG